MSPSLSKTEELLHLASSALPWPRMSVKASKFKSLVIFSGKILHDKSLCVTSGVNYQATPSSISNPVMFLERTISDALSDNYQPDSLTLALSKGLGLISNCHNCLAQKLWTFQHRLVFCLT